MNIREILGQWLKEGGYDGLYGGNCGCIIGNLVPCGEPCLDCQPGYKVSCPGPEHCELGGNCPWHISPNKTSQETTQKT